VKTGTAGDFPAEAYDYDLPSSLIAQEPRAERERSRLLTLDRETGRAADSVFCRIRDHLRDGDLLVVNDSKVFPARLAGRKATGGRADVLLLKPCVGDWEWCSTPGEQEHPGACDWECLIRSSGRVKPGQRLYFSEDLEAEVLDRRESGVWTARFNRTGAAFLQVLERVGITPLPPYIRRDEPGRRMAPRQCDRERYQTVFARRIGSAAAPTAGFHFSEPLCRRLQETGIRFAAVTLHVGEATFLPIRAGDIREHTLRPERIFVSRDAADAIRSAKTAGRRVVAVGTTVVRCLESLAAGSGGVASGAGWADLFICPGFRFRVVDALITNFHLPRSSLLVLVSAFAGREKVLRAYHEAIATGYRFFSYGDCMLIQ